MPIRSQHFTVCVIGGGPAGCIAAVQLARMGWDVALVFTEQPPEVPHRELIAPGAYTQLQWLNLTSAVAASCKARITQRRLLWGAETPLFLPTDGQLVDRAAFDAALRQATAVAGVKLYQVSRSVRLLQDDGGRWTLASQDGNASALTSEILVDATGRGSRQSGATRRIGSPLLSLCAQAPPGTADNSMMYVEAIRSGWLWAVSDEAGATSVCQFADPQMTNAPNLATALHAALDQCRLLPAPLKAAAFQKVVARNASSYVHADCASERHVVVGDASFSADPLLSHGLQWAITSAISAAAVVNTILKHPERKEAATAYHRGRQCEKRNTVRKATGALYHEGYRKWRARFWEQRSHEETTPPLAPAIRLPGHVHVGFSKAASFGKHPVLRGNLIDIDIALSHPSLERPIAFIGERSVAEIFTTPHTPEVLDNMRARVASLVGNICALSFINHLISLEIIVGRA